MPSSTVGLNKIDESKDVLGKVTLIREINFTQPHRGHLDILDSLALPSLVHPQKKPITDFDTLHAAWEQIFNVELLNERFYRELANWYSWALPQVEFPADLEPDDEKRRATGLIRLLTRLIFCWFLKEKDGLIPENLFHPTDLAKMLKGFDPESETSSTYYQAILQNLFFATLNQRMGKDGKGNPYRRYLTSEDYHGKNNEHGITNLYRYEEHFAAPEQTPALFEDIPFLNGGLFECLDREDPDDRNRMKRLDGFTTKGVRPVVPDDLFFGCEREVDLSKPLRDAKRKKEKVSGLIRILNRYKFTIVENTPIDQEIALDPELLGKVFENLLASYNPETEKNAREQTGSFYTPRPIVEYMVDESLKAHLERKLTTDDADNTDGSKQVPPKVPESESESSESSMSSLKSVVKKKLGQLFTYTEEPHQFSDVEVATLIAAIDALKVLDPACGSGAFPMGVLHKLVYILGKLDPDNERWKQMQLAKLDSAPMREELERAFADNNDDYGRKLYLIENCLYGVDIQPIAIQITKLRFFISLVCDQKTNRNKKENHGIRPLPNLETKFVAADTLIGLPEMTQSVLVDPRVALIEKEIESLYHNHFSEQNRTKKLANQRKVKTLRQDLAKLLAESLMSPAKSKHVAEWDPFDPQSSADFFDPHWMFGRSLTDGFDIIIGNPPYIQIQKFPKAQKDKWIAQNYQTYEATGDIYCLFYERGSQLLRSGGHLCYITSNKWMRAGYGEAMRNFFATAVDTTAVLDFGMAQNFGAATTYTCIVQAARQASRSRTYSCYATDDRAAMADPAGFFATHAVLQKGLCSDPWVIIAKERQRIKDLVEEQGVPLRKWDIQIYRGVLTGFNDAFYVTTEQRNAFIAEEPQCEKFLVPLLRGRYVERYATNWDGTWMIATFPALGYPAAKIPKTILRHLESYRTALEPKPQHWKGTKWDGRKSGPYQWFEIQDVISYHEEFVKPKIIYPNMTKFLPFYFDERKGYFTNDKGFIINSETQSLHYLTAFLNSHLFRCCFRDNFPELMGNTYEVRKIFMDKIPVKKPTAGQAALFEKLVPFVQLAKRIGEDTPASFLEDLIDACVMECYFREHMAQRDLLFLDDLVPHLANYDATASEAKQREFLTNVHRTLNAPTSKIRNRLLRLTADSPDLLTVIKKEGKV